ncbi:hypothetical protein CCR90_08990 [Rhodovulum sulfidophilum]|uniref:hypothetical protein n=1 Tax=Rhodovulum sulfidophilum TaxID=35806 RepID=UPI0030B99DCE|nr:hypothetical protein [Rhodovulum sulfidophilum]
MAELARRGFHTIPESGRAIIREQMQSGGDALPWGLDNAALDRSQLTTDIDLYR